MRARLSLTILAGLVLACSAAPKRPTGAGSTPVLRLLRDWRGVWSGNIKESPMGAMAYTLHVVEDEGKLEVTMARQKDENLADMHQRFIFTNFVRGTPRIHFHLSQRNTTQKGELTYREDLSSDGEAIFCAEECDKVKLTFVKTGADSVAMSTVVAEAAHSEVELHFVSNDIPPEAAVVDDRPRPKKEAAEKPVEKRNGSVDQDVVLKEHLDEDIGEVPDKKKDEKKK